MARRAAALEMAILGVISQGPLHGYELRKRLVPVLGLITAISYGALYPTLRTLVSRGLLVEKDVTQSEVYPKRNRIVYDLTDAGQARLAELVADVGTSSADDDMFPVRIAMFGYASPETRLRVLQGRRRRLEDRLDQMRDNLVKGRERLDAYTLELQQHGLDALEREVAWLGDMIDRERSGGFAPPQPPDLGTLKPRSTRPKLEPEN